MSRAALGRSPDRFPRPRVGRVTIGAVSDENRWVIVVPVKVASAGKTRLAGAFDSRARTALVRAMALDTVDAAAAAARVARVLVVTADPVIVEAAGPAFGVVAEPTPNEPTPDAAQPAPLNRAIEAGIAGARRLVPRASVAVLLGDVPALRPADLDVALGLADDVPRGFVADADGSGTTLLTGSRGADLSPRFGVGSAAAHAACGHAPLDVSSSSTLRRDVDVPADLEAVAALGLGGRTVSLLERLRG